MESREQSKPHVRESKEEGGSSLRREKFEMRLKENAGDPYRCCWSSGTDVRCFQGVVREEIQTAV